MRKTVPLSIVVPIEAALGSASPSLLTGNPRVDHTTHEDAPGRVLMTFLAISSILTTARPLVSCPVTTRRICRLIECPFSLGGGRETEERKNQAEATASRVRAR